MKDMQVVGLLRIYVKYAPASQLNPHLITIRTNICWMRGLPSIYSYTSIGGWANVNTDVASVIAAVRPRLSK